MLPLGIAILFGTPLFMMAWVAIDLLNSKQGSFDE